MGMTDLTLRRVMIFFRLLHHHWKCGIRNQKQILKRFLECGVIHSHPYPFSLFAIIYLHFRYSLYPFIHTFSHSSQSFISISVIPSILSSSILWLRMSSFAPPLRKLLPPRHFQMSEASYRPSPRAGVKLMFR